MKKSRKAATEVDLRPVIPFQPMQHFGSGPDAFSQLRSIEMCICFLCFGLFTCTFAPQVLPEVFTNRRPCSWISHFADASPRDGKESFGPKTYKIFNTVSLGRMLQQI